MRRGSNRAQRNVTLASAWVTYVLLAIGMIGPVVCVVWLVGKAVENENAVVRRLVADADARVLEDAEGRLAEALESIEPRGENGGAAFSWAEPAVTVSETESEEARAALGEARETVKTESWERAQTQFAQLLEQEEIARLRLPGGRQIGPMLLEMGLDAAGENTRLVDEFREAADRYVASFAAGEGNSRQHGYLIRRYARYSESDKISGLAERERMIESCLSELDSEGRFPPEPGIGRTSETLYRRVEGQERMAIFPLAIVETIASRILADGEDGVELIASVGPASKDDAVVRRVLAWPLDFAGLQMPRTEVGGAFSSEKAALYLWIGAIVLGLSAVSGVAIVMSLRRQASVAQLKNNLVATVTHELKTPVSSIRLLVDTLLDESRRGKVDTFEYIELISRENARLGRLIDNFLSFARMERGKGSFEMGVISARSVARSAEEAFRERFKEQAFSLESDIDENIPAIFGDRNALATALGNLLENAFKYGGEGKRIVLRAKADLTGAVFEVQDFGKGIGKRDRKRIFGKFYQAQPNNSERAGSVGLGLSIVEFIVSKHRGQVELDSELGKGSVFKMRIPYA